MRRHGNSVGDFQARMTGGMDSLLTEPSEEARWETSELSWRLECAS